MSLLIQVPGLADLSIHLPFPVEVRGYDDGVDYESEQEWYVHGTDISHISGVNL